MAVDRGLGRIFGGVRGCRGCGGAGLGCERVVLGLLIGAEGDIFLNWA